MRSEADNKKWGTIYLGGNKEATLESLDAMQAATRQEQWNQRTQSEYLDRVRDRATNRAREILGAAHTERQSLLEEARIDAERIRLETQVQYDKADQALADAEAIRAEAQALRDEAEAIRNAAQEEGFNTGLANARDELDAFRGAMGGSIAVVLKSIERQNTAIFSAWREEVVELVKTCVNKGTEWVIQDRHEAVLRALVMESVRQLENRHTVTLRVHPDDESAVADMFNAAREAMPDVDRWIVQGDPTVALGGLIAESPSSTVDNRLHLRTELVDGILQHLLLPEGEAEIIAAQAIHDVVREQVAHIETLAPPVPELEPAPLPETLATNAPEDLADVSEEPSHQAGEHDTDLSMQEYTPDIPPLSEPAQEAQDPELNADAPGAVHSDALTTPASATDMTDIPSLEDMSAMDNTSAEAIPDPIDPLEQSQDADANTTPSAAIVPTPLDTQAHAPADQSLAELEEELLPLLEHNSPEVNAVLAGGGFLSDDDTTGNRP